MRKIIGTVIGFIGYLIQTITKNESIAIKFYKFANKYDNRNNYSLAAHGMLLFREGKAKEAIDLFEKVKLNSKKSHLNRIAAMNLALCYWKLDNVDRAIKTLEELREKYEYLNENILTSLGYFYLLKDNYDKALHYSKKAIEDEPKHGPALDNLGQIYYRQGNFEKAEEYFLKALEYKDMIDSKYYLGLLYENQGKQDLAEEYFKKSYNTKMSDFSTVNKENLQIKYREYGLSSIPE